MYIEKKLYVLSCVYMQLDYEAHEKGRYKDYFWQKLMIHGIDMSKENWTDFMQMNSEEQHIGNVENLF